MVVSVNDVLVFSRTAQEHLQHVKRELQLLRDKQRYAKAQTCSFFMRIIGFFGHRVPAAEI